MATDNSCKDVFEPDTFAADTFASGTWRGDGVTVEKRALLGTVFTEPRMSAVPKVIHSLQKKDVSVLPGEVR